MKYVLKTTQGDYPMNFGNHFLQTLAKNKGVDFATAINGLIKSYGLMFEAKGDNVGMKPDAEITPFLDELTYVVQAAMQSANAAKGVFEKMPIEQVEYLLLDGLGETAKAFNVYGEIIVMVHESVNPKDLGKGDPKQKKSVAAKRK